MNILRYFQFLKGKKKAHYLIFALICIFLLLTALVYFLPTTFIDLEFSEEMQEKSSPFLDMVMKSISWFGVTWVAVSLVFGTSLIFIVFKYKKEALFIILTFLNTLVTFGIKLLINRPRPTEDVVKIVEKAQHQSFPSGHTSFYVVFFGFLVFLMIHIKTIIKPLQYFIIIFSLVLIFSVPFSRIYLGAHWFTDVVAGFILGLLMLYILIRLYLRKSS